VPYPIAKCTKNDWVTDTFGCLEYSFHLVRENLLGKGHAVRAKQQLAAALR
jgi:hypothetical protein